jgi:hypothetical protein
MKNGLRSISHLVKFLKQAIWVKKDFSNLFKLDIVFLHPFLIFFA